MIDFAEKVSLLEKAFGESACGKEGLNFSFKCPNCGDSNEKKKMTVKIDSQQWHCWVCEIKGGSIPSLLRKYSPSHYKEWNQRFEKETRRTHFDDDPVPEPVQPVVLPRCLPVESCLYDSDPDAMAAIGYLRKRNVSLQRAYRFRLCIVKSGSLRRRILIPSFDEKGNLNYWTARSIDQDGRDKYINSKAKRNEIIFNEVDVDWSKPVTLVEGPFDLLFAGENAIPMLGSYITPSSRLFQQIVKHKTPVIMALDQDAIQKSLRVMNSLCEYGIDVKFVRFNDSRDIADLGEEEFQKLLKKAVSWNFNESLMTKISQIASGSLF
jgi:predicted RNA-binding Zn-ribbon protein involved in translation (DUF1610 family)